MLKTLHLTNFQAHVDSKIEFNEGMNVFVGTNDANKSGVVRALNICLFNETFPPDYIHYGKKEAKIVLEFTDGKAVERVRTKSKNKLRLREADGTWSKEFSVSKVEEKLAEFTGFKEVCLDGSSKTENLQIINTGNEHDLMFGCSPETVLKKLSTLFGTTEIEQVKIDLSKELSSLNSEKKRQEVNLTKYKDRFEYLDTEEVESLVSEAYKVIDNFEEKSEQFKNRVKRLNDFKRLMKSLEAYSKQLENLEQVTNKAEKDLSKHKSIFEEYQSKSEAMEDLKDMIEDINLRNEELDRVTLKLEEDKKELDNYRCEQCGKVVKCLDC